MSVYTVTFQTSGWNKFTAEMGQQSIARELNELNCEYTIVSRLPFVIELSERQYLLFCLQWRNTVWEYSVKKHSTR